MFDIGFWELALIGIIALLVVGPERLPQVAATLGRWVGRARRTVAQLRNELEREAELAELRELRSRIERTRVEDLIEEAAGPASPAERGGDAPAATSSARE